MNPFEELQNKIIDALKESRTYSNEDYWSEALDDIHKWAEEIAGEWNGDEAGSQEERAHCANDIMEKCAQLKDLIGSMDTL